MEILKVSVAKISCVGNLVGLLLGHLLLEKRRKIVIRVREKQGCYGKLSDIASKTNHL
jgi:hypothetical protein